MFLGPVSGTPAVAELAPKEILAVVNELPLGLAINFSNFVATRGLDRWLGLPTCTRHTILVLVVRATTILGALRTITGPVTRFATLPAVSRLGRVVGATAELALELLDQGIGLSISEDTSNGLARKGCNIGPKFGRWNLGIRLGFGRSPAVRVSQLPPLLFSTATDITVGEILLGHVGIFIQI